MIVEFDNKAESGEERFESSVRCDCRSEKKEMERGDNKSSMNSPVVHDNEKYEVVKDIGFGNFGVVKLMREKQSKELVAVKFIERGDKIDKNVEREIVNHHSLRHRNIVGFKEVILTETHLGIVMEYAAGGELYHRVVKSKRLSQDDARFFFKQLISGVSHCHSMHICHRDLKLENMLLDDSAPNCLKICDLGYSKSWLLHSEPKSTVGTLAYIAPEVFSKKEYNGKAADVWSCGVALYVMLVGSYPFEDPKDPRNYGKTIRRILDANYRIPNFVLLSGECRQLLSRIFAADPAKRITIEEIQNHKWFLKKSAIFMPTDTHHLVGDGHEKAQAGQSVNEIMRVIAEARIPHAAPHGEIYIGDDLDMDSEDEADADSSGEFVCAF